MKLIHIAILAFFGLQGVAQAAVPNHAYTPEESKAIAEYNQKVAKHQEILHSVDTTTRLPWAEYGEAGYLIFNDEGDFKADIAKRQMARELPADMNLVVFTGNTSQKYQKQLFKDFAQYIDGTRLKVVYMPEGSRGFWARDGVPVPAWTLNDFGQKQFGVVDAKYYHGFEADYEFSQYFNADLIRINPYANEGGNFLANEDGECIVVNNERAAEIPDSAYKAKYGCQKLLRMPFIKGIGHIDESVKFMNRDTVIVDDPTYEQILKDAGYTTVKMPRPDNEYETYVNSLVVNGVVYVPVFGEKNDKKALQIYESFGLRAVPLDSTELSNDGMGSIHCITMVYPKVDFNEMLSAITLQDF